MKTLAIAGFSALLLSSTAYAADLSFPSEAPVATITIPDDWGPKETETGVDATSPDDAIYLSADVADAKDTSKVVQDAMKYLGDQGINIDTATEKQTSDTVNGMPATSVSWDGTDKDGPVTIGLSAITISADTNIVLTYWGTKGDEDKDGQAIIDIVRSLKPVAK